MLMSLAQGIIAPCAKLIGQHDHFPKDNGECEDH